MFARLLIAAVLAALLVPGVAQAHHTAVPVVALDYRNQVDAASAPACVHVSLEDAGRRLRLTVDPHLRLTVLGYENERFLFFGREGVAAAHYPTALSLRYVNTPGDFESLVSLTNAHSLAWPDARIWAPAAGLHNRKLIHWSVPVVVNGRRIEIRGELIRVTKPPLWPWLLVGIVPLLAAAAAARRRRWLWAGAGLAAVAGATTVANLGGFATGGLSISADRWAILAVEVTLTAIAIGALSRPRARLIAVAALAAFAVLQALSELAVFRHGVVVSGLPAEVVRAAAALALGSGLGAASLVFLAPTPQSRTTFSYVRTSRKEQA